MKFGKRFGLVAAIAALSVAPVISSLAQGSTCTLSAADCQTLATANANLAKETSFAFSYEFKADIKGDSPTSGDSTGSGQFSVTPPSNMSDPTAWANAITFAIDAKGSGNGGGNSGSGAISLVITGGNLYCKINNSSDWQGMSLTDAIKAGQSGGGGFGGMGGVNPAQLQQMFSNPDLMNAFSSLASIKGFITQEKTSNTPTVEDQKMSEFVVTLNPGALLSSPDFATALKAIMSAAMAGNPNAGAASGMNSDQIAAMLPMFGTMLGDTNLKITTWVGQTDNLYHALGLDLHLNVNMGAMGGGGTATTGTVHFLVQLTKVGQAVSVTAPSGAKMVSPQNFNCGASGGGVMPSVPTAAASS